MFKKPLSNIKTSAPLRSSYKRKLRQRVVSAYDLSAEDGDLLVPDGILSVKFITRADEPGVAYIDPEGDPLWFTIGKGPAEDLIPTVYTLWKKQDLLPFLSTPAAVVPILVGGADLMIPGVVHCPHGLREGQLVAIRQYQRRENEPEVSAPVAVGRMAVSSDQVHKAGTEKGKAVHVWHIWKDHLWDMGSKKDMPESTLISKMPSSSDVTESDQQDEAETDSKIEENATPPPPSPPPESSATVTYSPAQVTELLNKALVQAISTTLKNLPVSSFPIPATLLYTNHILPSRPAFPTLVLSPANTPELSSQDMSHVDFEITIKTSSHKSLSTFLKAAEKLGLLTLKQPQKQQPDILVTSVNGTHALVEAHTPYAMVKDLELRAAQRAAREERARESEARKEVEIKELWKPHQITTDLFETLGGSKNDIYTITQIRALLNSYIVTHNLVNPRDQAYINLDDALYLCVAVKPKISGKGKGAAEDDGAVASRFMKRDELTKAVVGRMQSWYEIRADGQEHVTKKGTLSPIQVVTKVRQGRKASTLISGFEPFLVVDAEEMADDLRKVCAGSTSVSQVQGKPGGPKLEVLVQGKQSTVVLEYLMGKGIPKKWIEITDLSGKK